MVFRAEAGVSFVNGLLVKRLVNYEVVLLADFIDFRLVCLEGKLDFLCP
jgi:hypothetical protein